MAIKGKVARILTSRELVINVGCDAGVKVGMIFDVLDTKGEAVTDPDSKEVLGSIQRPKVRVKVTSVQAKLSVATTYKKTRVNIGGTGTYSIGDLARMMTPPKWVVKYETLKTDESTWEDIEEKDSFVKTGDPVVQVLVSEEEEA